MSLKIGRKWAKSRLGPIGSGATGRFAGRPWPAPEQTLTTLALQGKFVLSVPWHERSKWKFRLIDCCHNYATVGEIVSTLKRQWGEFQEPTGL
jgi:hypothetical protein